MFKYFINTVLALSACALMASCSSTQKEESVEQKVEKQIQAEKPLNKPGDIAQKGHEAFLNAPGLTEAQKIKLNEVVSKTYADAIVMKTELGKTKGALFEAMVSPVATQKEINILKKKVIDLDKKRLDLMLKSMDEAQKIIGRNKETAEYFRRIMREHYMLGEGAM
ncbi:MAG: hypothetical protein BroJett040_19110 [Oligoflexia bacterium]|nr:MAG: hypothetical protein BroJett040_19110 [Oligoflexia bacterium]